MKEKIARWRWVRSWPDGQTGHILPDGWRSVLCKSGSRRSWVAANKDAVTVLCTACQKELEGRT